MRDFDLEKKLAAQRLAQYGQQTDFQAPQGQMVSGHFVAPNVLQYLAAGLRTAGGLRGQQLAQDELKGLSEQERAATANALRQFQTMSQGAPENAPGDGMGPVQPARQPDMRRAYGALLQAPGQQLQSMGLQGLMQIPEMEARATERKEDREMRAAEKQAQIQDRAHELQMAHQQRLEALQMQNASREQMAREQREFQRSMKEQFGAASAQPYFQPVQTGQGVMAFNARTGRVEPVTGPDGKPIVGAAADPSLQGAIAGAKTGATTEAKANAERMIEAPKVIAQGEETIRLVDDLLKSPGFKQAVGASRMFGVQKIPGTSAKDFDVRLDQLKGQQFLQAFESLKGAGQITEVEGKKATDAIARMDAAGSESEFIKAANEFQGVIRQGVERARRAQGGQGAQNQPPAATQRTRIRFDAQGNMIP